MMISKILVTEDDTVLKRFYQLALQDLCDQLTIVENPDEAMQLMEKEPFNFLITDLLFSKQTGVDVIKKAVNCCPEIKVLVASGHVTDAQYHEDMIQIENIKGYLQKPFTIEELIEKIRSIL